MYNSDTRLCDDREDCLYVEKTRRTLPRVLEMGKLDTVLWVIPSCACENMYHDGQKLGTYSATEPKLGISWPIASAK